MPPLAWLPTRSAIAQLGSAPKHQLVDPALAAQLLGKSARALLENGPAGPPVPRDGTLLGDLFESLVTLSVRVYAQAAGAQIRHLRTHRGNHEVDLIVERRGGRIVAIEIKLKQTPGERDTRDLDWLAGEIGDELLDRVIVTTGHSACRRRDGIAIVPAALLGP